MAKAAGLNVDSYHDEPPPLNEKRKAERLSRHLATVSYAEKALSTEPDNWVYDNSDGGVTLKPVTVSSHSSNRTLSGVEGPGEVVSYQLSVKTQNNNSPPPGSAILS